ncbi:HAMP domain-containing sensor histidine kinase [Curtobacterium sp. MCBA15_008]|uniref:sensor histidine kinase n=1 Tax=Curtobacterium sp. MCBA15_008 TaxID=1898736 RepID=UPI0008DC942A|nr:HAMP domain-containing sensor histidine kinase [Curtobacterium sp. MCBA15_008]OII08994.1 hypothetical protein BIU96_03535 [Curtobacterium sp. MCBA15_008]
MNPVRSRTWSIRSRTALVFAFAAMVLAAGVVVFSNLMSQAGIGVALGASTELDGLSGRPSFSATVPPAATETRPGRAGAADLPGDAGAADLLGRAGAADPDGTVARVVADQQWQWSAIGIAGAGIVAGGVGWLVSRRMLRPIDRITATANRISASNLHERIALDGPDDELRRLSGTVDDLLDRLQTAFESQRRFVAQASHELRTPLAVQRAAVQIGLHDAADPVDVRSVRDELLEQNRRTEHLVDSLLVLAEADRGLAGVGTPIDFAWLAGEIVAGAAGRADEAGVSLSLDGSPAPPGSPAITGEPTLVRQLFVNLVGNAVEYNHPGGFVRVDTRADGFSVENSGPVVPEDVAALLVEPFRRCPGAPSTGRHSGLGLSIVASIVQAHGWRLEVVSRAGGGLRVDVSSG